MVRADGYVKVLDFGAGARHRPSGRPSARTRSDQDTSPGTLLGTTAYMSPEQARGRGRAGGRHLRAGRRAVRDGGGPPPVRRRRRAWPCSRRFSRSSRCRSRGSTRRRPAAARRARAPDAGEGAGAPPTAREVDDALRPDGRRHAARAGAASAAAPRTTVGREGEREQLRRAYAARQRGAEPDCRRRRRGRHRQDQPRRGLSRRADVAARSPDRRARPLLGTAGRRRGLSADPRGARQPAAPRRRRIAADADEDGGADLVPAGRDAAASSSRRWPTCASKRRPRRRSG